MNIYAQRCVLLGNLPVPSHCPRDREECPQKLHRSRDAPLVVVCGR